MEYMEARMQDLLEAGIARMDTASPVQESPWRCCAICKKPLEAEEFCFCKNSQTTREREDSRKGELAGEQPGPAHETATPSTPSKPGITRACLSLRVAPAKSSHKGSSGWRGSPVQFRAGSSKVEPGTLNPSGVGSSPSPRANSHERDIGGHCRNGGTEEASAFPPRSSGADQGAGA